MFRVPTVLVVGAGASFEAGLPVGAVLLEQIAELLDIRSGDYDGRRSGDELIKQAAFRHGKFIAGGPEDVRAAQSTLIRAGWRISEAATEGLSIDAIIDQHEDPNIALMGKLAIARAILAAERTSLLRPPRDRADQLQLIQCRDIWLSRLGRLLVEGRRKSQIDCLFDNLTIITFNYDRCVEHYLPFSIASHYGVPLQEAQKLVRSARIFHPFGTVGRLPWLDPSRPVEFGAIDGVDLLAVAGQIRTFTEQLQDRNALTEMRSLIATAERIVFLGFAYHQQNLALLTPTGPCAAKSVLGTVKGISRLDQAVVERELMRNFEVGDGVVALLDMTCCEMFDQNWRSLTEGDW